MSALLGGGPGTPVGTVAAQPSSIPAGWLECDGAAVSRTLYAALFNEIGTDYGSGDGSTTFNIPDLRGEFVRGHDNSRGIDSGRVLGSYQADEFKSHTHPQRTNGLSGVAGPKTANGSASSAIRISIDTDSKGGNETRPRNVAMIYCIKF